RLCELSRGARRGVMNIVGQQFAKIGEQRAVSLRVFVTTRDNGFSQLKCISLFTICDCCYAGSLATFLASVK
ncbi:hypothetical protein J6590_022458, partial [Homalodisca vitripennis]